MHVKVYMTGTFFVLIRKAIQNTDFDIPFFVFSIMQIRSVIVILLQLKSGKNWINDISWNKSSVLVTWHHKCLLQKKQNDTLNVVAMTTFFATGAVLIKSEIPRFFLNQELSTPHNLLMGVTTTWKLCLFQVGPFCLTLEVANRDICFLDRNILEPKELLWPCNLSCFVRATGSKFVPHCYYAVICVYGIITNPSFRVINHFILLSASFIPWLKLVI